MTRYGKALTTISVTILLTIATVLLSSCTKPHSVEIVKVDGEPVVLRHAKRFEIIRKGNLKIITVKRPWRGATRDFTYLLYPRGTTPPKYDGVDATIPYPCASVILTSTTSAVFFMKLKALDVVAGMTNPNFVNTPEIVERIKSGDIQDIGGSMGTASDLNRERLVAIGPEIAITHASGSVEHDVLPQIQALGITVVMNGSYMEETPLGRTEWIRFYAAFLDKEDEADRIFSVIEAEYDRLKKLTSDVDKRPKVLCNVAFKGDWTLPGGKSYMSTFMKDAGASYPWTDNTDSGGFQVDMEEVLAKAADADIWLNPGLCKSLKDMTAIDSRYKLFAPFKTGMVFNHIKRVNATGGHDFWERGAANPHLVLADYISIIHPELLPNHQCTWYEKLPEVVDDE